MRLKWRLSGFSVEVRLLTLQSMPKVNISSAMIDRKSVAEVQRCRRSRQNAESLDNNFAHHFSSVFDCAVC
jgi:hypothetical protein